MKDSLAVILLMLTLGGFTGGLRAQPADARLPREENACIECHTRSEAWYGDGQRLYVAPESLAADVHAQNGVHCHDCHGGDPRTPNIVKAHATDVAPEENVRPFLLRLGAVMDSCANCHPDQAIGIRKSVHAHAGEKNTDGSGKPLACDKCHGSKVHGMLPTADSRSPVFLDHQVETCSGCHEEDLETYITTVHGRGLYRSGLLVTAVCADCHGAHNIFYSADKRSTLHASRVDTTCGACHSFLAERLETSVHGRSNPPGDNKAEEPGEAVTEEAADDIGGRGSTSISKRGSGPDKPPSNHASCTDCHLGHEMLDPGGSAFHQNLSNRCGNCHPAQTGAYAMSTHGELTQLGYTGAADCSDCHGAHDILAVGDPRARMASSENRLEVCRQCHTYAVANFSQFDPHANHHDAENYPWLHSVYLWLLRLFYFFFAFFLIHSFLWFVRSFIGALLRGRHETLVADEHAIMFYEPVQLVRYTVLFVTFLGLLLTGLTLKFGSQSWAQSLARRSGGFQVISVWHLFFAFVAIVGCVAHVARGIGKIRELRKQRVPWGTIVFGPDSRVPNRKDARDLLGMACWFFGLGPRPSFERWSYWQKFDYWAVYLTAAVIGTSGLLLWYPNLFCRFLPGETLNFAKVIHNNVAVTAASFLFMFHFYNTHFRPEKFPLDMSALTGMVSEEHLRTYRGALVDRLQREGKLDALRRTAPSRGHLLLVFLAGAVVFTVGVGLLVLVLVATMGK